MKRNITRSFCLILLLLTASLCLQAQTLTYYVSANSGNDANNGTTTTTSFKTLQKAITAMNSNPAALEIDILVEGGVYKPTDGTGDATTRTVSFNFFRNFYPFLTNAGGKKLKIQGGYNFSTGVRDFVHNPSYLDGDIGEAGNAADNSYHVVIIGSTNSTEDSTVVDGFQILHGNADGGGGLVPITPYFSVPSGEGGGIELQGNNNPRIAFQNCVVRDNLALKGGGVVSFFSAGLVFRNCVFANNSASQSPGGAFAEDRPANTLLVNCLFTGNKAVGGSAYYLNVSGNASLVNCTITGNTSTASGVGGAIYTFGNVAVTNTIIWNNAGNGVIKLASSGTATVSYSDVQGGVPSGTGNISADPQFLNANSPIGTDGFWMTPDDGLGISSCSPAKDAGDKGVIPSFVTTDLKGGARVFNNIVDMGAYENTETPTTKNAYPDNDGDSYGDESNATTYTCTIPTGFITTGGDCDDSNPHIHPGATEVCDNVDNNCDGQIDEGITKPTWYLDADKDGFGDPANLTQACSKPDGYVNNNSDCDDTQTTYADNDGDGFGSGSPTPCGVTDNTDCDDGNSAINPTTVWYKDADGDSYSDGTTLTQCTRPTAYKLTSELTATSGDCNDDLSTVYPGAPEICGNNVDDNCNGQIDEGCVLTVNIQSASTTEGNSGKHAMNFTLQLTKPAPGKCDVQYYTKDLTAKVGNDYQQTKGTVSFSKGQSSKTITVYVYGDRIKEGNEQFQVILEKSKNVTIGTGTATGTIIDDDGVITMAARTNPQSADTETDLVVPNVLHRSQLWRIPLLPTQNQVMVIDINGRIILKAPNYSNQHSFINVASGIYFYQIQTTKPNGKPKLYKGKLLIID